MKEGAVVLAALALLAGCVNRDREPILPGERLDIRAPLADLAADGEGSGDETAAAEAGATAGLPAPDVTSGVRPVPVSLPGTVANAEWTHRGGTVTHRIGNAAASASPQRVWSANVGAGDNRRQRVVADPVVAGGRVFALDANARVTAVGTNGAPLWSTDLTPVGERASEASGGGLAVDGGRVFATTGFGEVVALDAASGAVAWRQVLESPAGGAALAANGTVYVASRDGTGWALRATDGKVLWRTAAAPGGAGVMGVSSPALAENRVVYPFTSGQLVSADAETGATVWQTFVAGRRLGRAIAGVSDLTGDPVIADNVVYAGSSSGRLSAFNNQTGEMVWQAKDGPMSPIVLAGGSIWLVSDENQLVRLDASTGATVWRIDLPFFTKDKAKRRREIFVHYGPVLAAGRLWTASSDGFLRAFDPASGAVVAAVEVPGGAASSPVVAGGTIYVLSRNGQLHAFR